jgi:hypothetical protein
MCICREKTLCRSIYADCAIDPFTKKAAIHVASNPSSTNAKVARKKAVKRFGKGVTVVNDNGSENIKDAQAFLRENPIAPYWTRPKSPKEKPFVERFIRPSVCCRKERIDWALSRPASSARSTKNVWIIIISR